MAVAADVGPRWDVVIDGTGYMLLETEQKQATFTFAPTFLERTNISQAYGDDDQDFWLTMSQKDWSLGEGQRYFHPEDDGARRYWTSNGVRTEREGRLSLLKSRYSVTLDATPTTNICKYALGQVAFAAGTDGYVADESSDGSIGAHGATSPTAACWDRENLYVSGYSGSLQQWDGASWTTFSATPAGILAYLNNTLYGLTSVGAGGSTTALYRYSTAGAATTVFTWRGADGSAVGTATALVPYGGDLAIVVDTNGPHEVWIYDGVAPAKVMELPNGVFVTDVCVVSGVLMLGCIEYGPYGASASVRYFQGGQTGRIWRSELVGSTAVCRLGNYAGTLIFTDSGDNSVKQYDPETGAVTTLFTNPVAFSGSVGGIGCQEDWFLTAGSSTTARIYPHASTYETSGSITSALFDGDTTRTKRFKGVVVEWDAASDGDGGSVDISYRLNDPDGSFTSLQTAAVSGTEYAIGQSGRSISIKVTINKGSSTSGPTVKRVYVRAAPILDSFRMTQYVLNLTGRDGEAPLALRDGTFDPNDGLTLATALKTSIQSTSPVSITDDLGTYSALLEPAECQIVRVRPQEYVAIVQAREV